MRDFWCSIVNMFLIWLNLKHKIFYNFLKIYWSLFRRCWLNKISSSLRISPHSARMWQSQPASPIVWQSAPVQCDSLCLYSVTVCVCSSVTVCVCDSRPNRVTVWGSCSLQNFPSALLSDSAALRPELLQKVSVGHGQSAGSDTDSSDMRSLVGISCHKIRSQSLSLGI